MSRYFNPETDPNMVCRCCKVDGLAPDFLAKLDTLRERYGKPLIVNSGYRCPDYNARISGTGPTGPHTTGRAVDLRISGKDAHALISLASGLGFTGIGVSQKGAHTSRFIHLDDLTGPSRPWVWSY